MEYSGDADVASAAALLAEPARAKVLLALADGRALPASLLATEAGVAPQTISSHLHKLLDGGLLKVEQSGRHRYYRLAGPEVAAAVEAVARISKPQPVKSLRQSTRASALREARHQQPPRPRVARTPHLPTSRRPHQQRRATADRAS